MLHELDNYDWSEVFGEGSGGNTDKATESVGDCPADPPPMREDVVEILAMHDGENDVDNWHGVFRLRDGRWLFATGGCDYTGWD